MKSMCEAVSDMEGDGWVGLPEEFSAGVGSRCEIVADKVVDNLGIKDEDGREAKGLGFKGQAERMGLSLVDIGSGCTNCVGHTVGAYQAGMCEVVQRERVSDWDAEGAEDGSGCGAGVFAVVAAICGPDERGVEGVGYVFEKA